ncbi:MAG: cytochrome c oxidase assembly protein [Micromonosporaceae bacterium]|nr:cytochrome c oxidase assembly protein [Micromonosporaceae bacterium]
MSTVDPLLLAHPPSGYGDAWIEVATVLALATLAAGYGRGVHEIWARLGIGAVVSRASVGSFASALVLLYLADQGPLHTLAEGSLAGHMTQHMILLLAGGLLAAGRAGLPLTLATPHRVRRWLGRQRVGRLGGWLRRPLRLAVVAATIHTATLWFWHLPRPFLAAVESPTVHLAEHASLVLASWLLWSTVVKAHRADRYAAVAFFLLVTTGLAATALAAVLTFAPAPIYPPAAFGPPPWPAAAGSADIDPLTDQQLAGLVMWVPMDVVVLGIAGTVVLRWLTALEQRKPAERDRRPVANGGGWPR